MRKDNTIVGDDYFLFIIASSAFSRKKSEKAIQNSVLFYLKENGEKLFGMMKKDDKQFRM